MIEIARIYEEFDVDEEDGRRFTRGPFGAAGDAWATVYGVDLTYSSPGKPTWTHRFLKALGRAVDSSGRDPVRVPFSGSFQLRVCSPSFREGDDRFVTADGRQRALVQEEFSPRAVEEFCRNRVARAGPPGLQFVSAMEQDFFYYDPDEDPA
jgi:hypothetical protein